MAKKTIVAVAIFLFLFSTTGYAQSTSLGVKASTLGLGLELERSFSDSISGRIGVNYFTYGYSGTEDNIEYDFDLKLRSVSALLDWHPFKGSFRFSGGAIYNGNKLDAKAKPSSEFDIGDGTYYNIDTLKGKINFNDIAPYLGFGWNTSSGKDKGFGFLFELGAIYQGSPRVELSATGADTSLPDFQANLAKEEDNLQSDMDEFKIYPVIALGLIYRF